MPTNRNGMQRSNGHVQLTKAEYDAFISLRDETHAQLIAQHAKLLNNNIDLTQTCNAQVTRLALMETRLKAMEELVLMRREIAEKNGFRVVVDVRKRKDGQPHTTLASVTRKLVEMEDVLGATIFEGQTVVSTWPTPKEIATREDRGATFTQSMLQTHIIRDLTDANAKLSNELVEARRELEEIRKTTPNQK